MSRARKIQIVYNNCPRCGKILAGLSRSIHGSESMRRKYAGLCGSCITDEERNEILEDQAQGILKSVGEKNSLK
jgi:NMD protein affecting ribosome stability and mRNA decay